MDKKTSNALSASHHFLEMLEKIDMHKECLQQAKKEIEYQKLVVISQKKQIKFFGQNVERDIKPLVEASIISSREAEMLKMLYVEQETLTSTANQLYTTINTLKKVRDKTINKITEWYETENTKYMHDLKDRLDNM